jgi:segregation and condensation protein B
MIDNGFDHAIVEALILASPEPLQSRKIVDLLKDTRASEVSQAVAELNEKYAQGGLSYRIRELAGGYQFYIMPQYSGYVQELFTRRRKMRLTRAALETLAIIAYRQPATKTEIEHIRGVASDGVIHNLLEKKMITIKGRAKTVGKPLQYGTTDEFLKFFGINSLTDLPKMAEIEELVSQMEDTDQTELTLQPPVESTKLNIADGTYDPSVADDDDMPDEMSVDVDGDGPEEDDDADLVLAGAAEAAELPATASAEGGATIDFDDTSRENQ